MIVKAINKLKLIKLKNKINLNSLIAIIDNSKLIIDYYYTKITLLNNSFMY
eukprot:UN00698